MEEISKTAVRLSLDEPLTEGIEIEIRGGAFHVRAVVVAYSVRADDFCLEARFLDDFHWTPEVWTPDHLYRPGADKSRGAAGGRE